MDKPKIISIAKWVLAAIVLAFVGWKFVAWVNTPTGNPAAAKDLAVSDSDWSVGPKDAKATVVEYSDFECPACGSYNPIMDQLKIDYKDKVRFVYRHFPLTEIHKNAYSAALAAEAAGKQGKFWEMGDKLFGNQAEWSNLSDPKDKFVGYAQELSLDKDKFVADYDNKVGDEKIKSDIASGNTLVISGTPTFYVNGNKIENPAGLDAFKTLLDNSIK